jgi:hypothetical protein
VYYSVLLDILWYHTPADMPLTPRYSALAIGLTVALIFRGLGTFV